MVNLLFEKYDNFGLISGRIWQVPLCSSHIDLHTYLHTELHAGIHTDVDHVNRSELALSIQWAFNPTPPIFVFGLPLVCPRYDHSMYFSTTSMYPLALLFDVNRPGVIMIQTDVAQSILMTPHQFLLHVVHADVALASSLVYLTDTKTTPRQRASHLDVILILVQGQPDPSPWCRVRAESILGALKSLARIDVGEAVSLLFDSKATARRYPNTRTSST